MQTTEKNMRNQLIKNVARHAMQAKVCLKIMQDNLIFLSQHESDQKIDFLDSINEFRYMSNTLDVFVDDWLEIREEQL